jgi:hypothetical protein
MPAIGIVGTAELHASAPTGLTTSVCFCKRLHESGYMEAP